MRTLRGICLIAVFMVSFCFILSPLVAQEKKDAEGIYTIKQGDTLWDISAKFFKDPFLWPKLWQRNQYITNPHWIFPGQPVLLSLPEEIKKEEPKQVVAEEKPKEVEVKEVPKVEPPPPPPPPVVEKKPEVVVETKPVEEKPLGYPEIRSAGFMSEIDYQGIGIVIDNREGKNLMAEGDIIYLAFKTADPVLVGNKYTVFRTSETIRHPVTDKKIGRKYNITGNIQIIDHFGSFYTAKVTEAFEAIYKGDLIQPYSKEKMEGVVNK